MRAPYTILLFCQTDTKRFNRGQLLNVGFLLAAQSCDYVAMHDVDLLPLNTNLSYRYPQHIMHLASAKFHPIYKFPKFIGGIMVSAALRVPEAPISTERRRKRADRREISSGAM